MPLMDTPEKTTAQQDVFKAVSAVLADVDQLPLAVRAQVIREAALAYRYAAGGPQPGSPVPAK